MKNKYCLKKFIKLEMNNMNTYKITLKEMFAKKLGIDYGAKKLFQEANQYKDVTLDFDGIEFMSRSFGQEYVVQRHYSKANITEINMCESIERLLEVVQKDFEQTCLNLK